MYLAIDSSSGTHVFTDTDPRNQGFSGRVRDDISLVDEYPEILRWPHNEPPAHWLGVSEQSESEYRVFPSPEDCRSAGFRVLGTHYWTGKSWQDWQRIHHEV